MNEQAQSQESPRQVECPAAKDPAVRLFIFAAILIGFGAWCFIDGYVKEGPSLDEIKGINQHFTYYLNHGGGIVFPIAGLVPLVWGVVFLRRRLIADDEGVGYAGKDKLAWSDVKSLDSSKLAGKGILKLLYVSEGRERAFVLDGWKLQNFQALVAMVEKKVGGEKTQP